MWVCTDAVHVVSQRHSSNYFSSKALCTDPIPDKI